MEDAHTNCLWCVAEKRFRFAYMIFIVKGQGEIYLASKVVDAMVIGRPKSVMSCRGLYVHFCQ